MTWGRVEGPTTPERGAARQCSRCPAAGNGLQGVLLGSGKWICPSCYRRMATAAGVRRR